MKPNFGNLTLHHFLTTFNKKNPYLFIYFVKIIKLVCKILKIIKGIYVKNRLLFKSKHRKYEIYI